MARSIVAVTRHGHVRVRRAAMVAAGASRAPAYANEAAADVVLEDLYDVVVGGDAVHVPAAWTRMVERVRNIGRSGIAAMGISAVDAALWDLKARLLHLPLVTLFGAERAAVPIYESGGFTSYSERRLCEQLAGWVESGIARVKMKVGRNPYDDAARVHAVRRAIGDGAELFVDANGAYDRKAALAFARRYADLGVTWFEEPVSSDDLDGLRLLRDRGPYGMQIAAGEYGYDLFYLRRMLGADGVLSPRDGALAPDLSRAGAGLELKRKQAERFAV